MYSTPKGDRILVGAERRLFEESLGTMVDLLADCDADFGVPGFDQFQLGSKFYALYRSGRALLRPDEPAPERVAYLDAAIAAVYQHTLAMVAMEIEGETGGPAHFWRTLVFDAARENDSIEDGPDEASRNETKWEFVVECMMEDVLWDRDFEIEEHLDVDSDLASAIKGVMGIPPNYFIAVPLDPPDGQLNLYVDALMGLTPRGRGEDAPPKELPGELTGRLS